MTLLRLSQARDVECSSFQTSMLGHFQQLRELGQGLDLHLHLADGGKVVSIHKVVMVSRSVWLAECLAGEAPHDLVIPNATEDSVSTLVSLLYGGSPTVAFGVYAGIQALCHCLGLNSWLYEMVTTTVQEEAAVMDLVQQLDPSDEDGTSKHGQESPIKVASVGGALKTLVKRPTQPKNTLDSRSKGSKVCRAVKGSNRSRHTVQNTDLEQQQTAFQEKPKRCLRPSNERTLRSIPPADTKTPPNGRRKSSRSCVKSSRSSAKQKFTCELCSASSSSSEMLETHYNKIHFNKYTRGDGRGGSLSAPRKRAETGLNINRKVCVEMDRGTIGKQVGGIKSLGENFNGAQGRVKKSVQGKMPAPEMSKMSAQGRAKRSKSVTAQQTKPPTTSSASRVCRMKVVVPAVEDKITSTTSSMLVSTGDKKDMYFSMWNETLSDKVPKQGPISGRLQQELSPAFSKFISANANMIISRGLQKEARHHAANLLQDGLISIEVAKKAVTTLKDLSK